MSQPGEKLKVLFVCTGNACRSQMAEGWAEHLKSDCIEPFSAGVAPAGVVSGQAIRFMAEAGVDISHHYSKHIEDLAGIEFDYVITLCNNAHGYCPVFPAPTKMIHCPFEDPSFMIGTDQQIAAAFRRTRDKLRNFVAAMPQNLP